MEEDEPQSNMVSNEKKIPQCDGAEFPQSIKAKDLDRTNDESSIPTHNLDEEKPQVTSSSSILDAHESIEGKPSVLEEGLVESEGKRRDLKVDEITGDNIDEKLLGFDGLLANEQLTKQLSQLAEKEENFSSVEEALVEKDEKILPLVEGLGEGGGEVKAGVFHEVKHESFEEKFSDFDQIEHLKEEPPLLDEEEKVSSLKGGFGDNGGEVKAHVLDDVMQEGVEEKLLDFDETHQYQHLKEELPVSDEKEEKVFSLEEALVAKDENNSSLEEGLGKKDVEAHVFDEVKDDEASSYQGELDRKEKKASTLKQEGDEEVKPPLFKHSVSIGEKELTGEGTRSAEGSEKVHPLQEALIEKDEKVSPCEEGLVEKEEAKDHVLYGTMQENVEWKPADSDEKSVEKVSPLQGDSVEKYKEESDEEDAVEMDTDEGGPASAAGRRTAMKQKSNHPRATQGRRIRARSKPKEDESLCFICFDGGDLVLCDHRSCPKVYHPSCVNRDEEYFKAKGQWICGWHICSNCQKSAHYMCYTCTYSMCRGCIKEAEFVCVRGSKGFCQDCMKTVLLIETNKREDGTTDVVDFDDKTSWLSLFKDYWLELNAKLLLTMEDLTRARNPLKEANVISCDEEMSKMRVLQYKEPLENSGSAHDDQGASSSSRPRRHKESTSARRTWKKRSRNTSNKELREAQVGRTSISGDIEWASKELLEFVAHMKDGDTPVLSHFDVQALLLQYIKQNNLRDPLRKSQIICDARLMSLFGKARVGHLEILKLLDPHLLIKEASPLATDDNQGGVVDPDPSQMDAEGNSDASTKTTLDTRRKVRRKMEGGSTNLDEYAAIDVHNVSLLYLRRNLMECLLEDIDMFNENVVGAFVRIRISGSSSNKDLYRLVQIVGTGKAAGKYRTGKKTTDITLEILNLSKRDVITIDLISNQEFTEEECKRLRQSVKCGFIDRLTVAQVQEKARGLHTLRVNDWLESEKLRLGHLRDRASEKGRKKEHRECVEKLQLLSTPEEHLRRLNEVPDIHVDPKMALDYESTEDEDLNCERQALHAAKNKMVKYSVRDRDEFSARRGGSATRKDSDVACNSNRSAPKAGLQDVVSPNAPPVRIDGSGNNVCQVSSLKSPKANVNANGTDDDILKNSQPVIEPAQFSCIPPQTTPQPQTTNDVSSNELCETDKMWHYQDPAGKIQGPFSMAQLRKWSSSGFFPTNLRIWRTSEKQEDSVLLTDAVSVKFHKDLHKQEPQHSNTNQPAHVAAMADPRVDNVGDGLKANNTSQPTQPSSLSTTITGMVSPTDGRLAISSIGCESSKDFNALSGQTQGYNCPRPITPFPRNSTQQPSFQGRGGRGESNGRWNGGQDRQHNWNYNRPRRFLPNGRGYERQHPYRSSSGQRFSGEQLKVQQPANIPAHAPQAGSMDWASLQGALNRIIPSPSPCNLPSTMNSVGGCVSNALTSVNPAKTQENIGVLNNLQPQNKPLESAAPVTPGDHLVYGGSNATQIVDGSNRKQLLEGNGSSIAPNTDQASTSVLNSEYMQPTNSHVNETGDHTVPSNKVDATMMPTEAQQEAQASADKRLPVGGMPLGSAVASNPIGSSNLPDASASTSKAQSESRCFSSVSVQEHGSNALNVNPAQPSSMVYPATPGTTNSGWGMVAHGPVNSNWGTPANMNMGWAQPAQAIMNLNLGWAIPTQGMPMHVSSAVNPGWVAPVIGNANPNPCWVAPPTVGNANQSAAWGSMMPGSGQASMNNTSNQNAGDGGSSHPQPGEQRLGVCKFHESGHCKKGASCNYIHL